MHLTETWMSDSEASISAMSQAIFVPVGFLL